MRRARSFAWPGSLIVLGLAVGFDTDRPSTSARIREVEMELGAALDE